MKVGIYDAGIEAGPDLCENRGQGKDLSGFHARASAVDFGVVIIVVIDAVATIIIIPAAAMAAVVAVAAILGRDRLGGQHQGNQEGKDGACHAQGDTTINLTIG
ncbi:hypothetical protein G5V65_19065 [Rhodobacter sp. HX-7-19]|uniref:Uncharacterized protein n=1 Tax=Paragemmobacter kunshanensis TaxID=2583234 RepID=A0A6M1TZM7_9RHOB|nr:hypothetical protein [Rhodobacter kunshanensis]NGQ92997.1 hypothetical protein [Rhodobacter kunshanensis]